MLEWKSGWFIWESIRNFCCIENLLGPGLSCKGSTTYNYSPSTVLSLILFLSTLSVHITIYSKFIPVNATLGGSSVTFQIIKNINFFLKVLQDLCKSDLFVEKVPNVDQKNPNILLTIWANLKSKIFLQEAHLSGLWIRLCKIFAKDWLISWLVQF